MHLLESQSGSPRISPLVAGVLVSIAALAACGDKGAAPGGSASSAASAAPPACDGVPRPEQEKRCDAGDGRCCTILLDAMKPADAKYGEAAGKACASGNEHACETVRDGALEPGAKLDILDKACTSVGRWTCRLATQLAVVVAIDRVPKVFDNACKHSGDSEMSIGGQILKCQGLDKTKLDAMVPIAKDCKSGDLAACKQLGGVDGAAVDVFSQVAWQMRGVDPNVAAKSRVEHDYLGPNLDQAPGGHVTITFTDAGSLDKAALAKGLETASKDNLQRCLGWALEHDATTAGDLELDATIDKMGRIAYVKEKSSDKLKTKTDLVECVRHRVQDALVAPPQSALVPAVVKIHFAK